MPGSVFVTLYGSSTYNVIRSCQIAFQISYIILHTHQSCMKDALTLHPCQYLMFKHLIFFLKLISPLCRMFEGEDMFKLVLCIGWDGWMASPSQWTWVWLDPGSWWWTGKSGMLQSTGLQSRTWLNDWTTTKKKIPNATGFRIGKQGSVQFSRSVVSDPLQPHGLQHTRPPCQSPTPGAYSNSCPLSRWCHPTISSFVFPFSSCPQSFPTSKSFPMIQLFASGDQSTGASLSASVLPGSIQGWFPLGLTSLIFLQSKGFSMK